MINFSIKEFLKDMEELFIYFFALGLVFLIPM